MAEEVTGLILDPVEPDGRRVMVNSPSTEGWYTWFCGHGDDLVTPKRGKGTKLLINLSGPTTGLGEEVQVQYIEPVELQDGQVNYTPIADWNPEDEWDWGILIPATEVTPNGTTEGNCNLSDIGGGVNLIIPASGDGTHDVDLDQAVPVPAGGVGYWEADAKTGVVTVSSNPGAGQYYLLDTAQRMWFCYEMPMGDPRGINELDTDKAEWISERWKLCFRVRRSTAGSGKAWGFIKLFRPSATAE